MDEIQPATSSVRPMEVTCTTVIESDDEAEKNVFLALFFNHRQLGVAYYSEESNEMSCAELTIGDSYAIVDTIIKQVSPTSILLPTFLKNVPKFVEVVDRDRREQSEATEATEATETIEAENRESRRLGPDCEYLSSQMFSLDTARQQINLISVPGMQGGLSLDDKMLYLSSIFDVDTERSLRATGGLLSYLLKNDHIYKLENEDEPVRLNRIRRTHFDAIMDVDAATLQSLQIFHVDSHPLGFGAGKSKEGISLYGLLNRTSSSSGARLLKKWITTPKLDMPVIMDRLNTIDFLSLPVNAPVAMSLKENLKRLKHVPGIIGRIRTLRTGVNDWKNLHHSARAILSIVQTVRAAQLGDQHTGDDSVVRKLQSVCEDDLRSVVSWIASVVDLKQSGQIVVRDGFSEDIDELRRCLAGLDDFLTSVGVKEMQTLMDKFSLKIPRIHLIYYPQIGYLLLLDQDYLESDAVNPTIFEEAGLEFMFSSPEHGYFKNETCYQLDKDLGDVYGAVVDLEGKAIRYLESKVLPLSGSLLDCHDLVTQLDCMLAMATVARENNYCKPVLDCDHRGYAIENGRHPLQELVVSSFVGNDTKARGGDIQVVTGPNYSGKSVYLKQVGLIVFMAHIGSFVPATAAHIGVTDSIKTRISTLETVSVPQSAFFTDCAQISRMVQYSTKKSLLLIDEFGKGTSDLDGVSLLGATILHFVKTPVDNSPTCFFTTHFYHLLAEPYLPLSDPRISTFSMEVLVDKPKEESESLDSKQPLFGGEKIVFLHKLQRGSICVESQALQCALRAEIPRHIVRRALEIREAKLEGLAIPAKNSAATEQKLSMWEDAVNKLLSADLDSCSPTELLASMKL